MRDVENKYSWNGYLFGGFWRGGFGDWIDFTCSLHL